MLAIFKIYLVQEFFHDHSFHTTAPKAAYDDPRFEQKKPTRKLCITTALMSVKDNHSFIINICKKITQLFKSETMI